jgi:hypothetical protein
MRLPSLLACSLGLVGLLSSAVSAQTNIGVFTGRGPTTQASWDIVSAAGCLQNVTFSVNSSRFLIVDTSSRSVIKETSSPSLTVIINQWDGPGCEQVTISDLIDNLSAAQFTRTGVQSATLNVEQIVLSDPLIGKYVIDAHLHWTGVGPTVATPTRDRFCDGESCVFSNGVDQNRNATVTGTVTATVKPLFGSTFTADYSPSAGTQLTARLENTVSTNRVQF